MRAVSTAAGAVLAAVAALAVTAVPAPAQSSQIPLTASGALTITWQGDPARGCAPGAPCDVLGSAVLPLDARGSLFAPPGGRNDRFFADLFEQRGVVVRVRRRGADQAGPTCVDGSGSAGFGFGGPGVSVDRAPEPGAVTFALEPPSGLGTSRCATPLPADVRPVLPRATVGASALRAGNRTIALGGTRTFAAGPFTGTVASTVAVRVGEPRRQRSRGRPVPRRPRPPRRVDFVDTLRLTYDLTAGGELTSAFSGLGAPECDLLDACGLTGATALAPADGGEPRRLVVFVRRTRRAGPRSTVAQLLRPIRAGDRLPEVFGAAGEARVRSSARREGAPGCAEETDGGTLSLQRRRERGERNVVLDLIAYGFGRGGGPALRTRCPGPGLTAGAPLAAGRLPVRSIGAPTLTVRLAARGGEGAPGYAVAPREGTVVLRLRRRSATVTTNRRVRFR